MLYISIYIYIYTFGTWFCVFLVPGRVVSPRVRDPWNIVCPRVGRVIRETLRVHLHC